MCWDLLPCIGCHVLEWLLCTDALYRNELTTLALNFILF